MSMILFEQDALKVRKDYLRGILTEEEYTARLEEIATAIIISCDVEQEDQAMSMFTLDEIIYGMNQRPTEHNIRVSMSELKRRGYSAFFDTYLNRWILS